MKYRIIALLALILAGTLAIRAAYSWYLIDNFAGGVVNSTNWQQNNIANGPKMAISKLAIPDGSVDHEVRSTLPATCPGTRVYVHLLRATSNYDDNWTGDAYRISVRLDVPNCIMTFNVSKSTSANGWTQLLNLTNQPYPGGATWRSFVRNDGPSPGVTVILGDQQWTLNDTSLTTGKPGVGHNGWPYPTQLSFAELPVSLGAIDRIAPAAATSLNAIPNANNIQLTWTAAVDDTNGYGILNYELYKNGVYVSRTHKPVSTSLDLLPAPLTPWASSPSTATSIAHPSPLSIPPPPPSSPATTRRAASASAIKPPLGAAWAKPSIPSPATSITPSASAS